MSFACPECGCPTGVVMTCQLTDEPGGTLRRRVCHGPLCGHRFYSLQQPEVDLPAWAIEWAHNVPSVSLGRLPKREAQP